MRILNVSFNFPGYAGDSPQIDLVSQALRKRGHDVDIAICDAVPYSFGKEQAMAYEPTRQKLLKAADGEPITIHDIPVYVTHSTIRNLGMYCPNAKKFAKELVPNYDVIHIFYWYFHLANVFYQVAKEMNVPYIFSAGGALLEGAHDLKKGRKSILDFLYTKKMVPSTAACCSLGEDESQSYIDWGASKVYRIDNALDLENFKIKNQTTIFEKNGIDPKNQPYLLFLSRVDPKKGPDLLLKAFAKYCEIDKNHILIIAGDGVESYVNEMKELANKLGIKERVKFTGFVSVDEKLELLKNAKLYALTSVSDVHPIASVDALAMGAPMLVTRIIDYPEIEEYNAGKLVDTDVEEIYLAMKEMLSDEEKLKIYSLNAKKLIEEKFLLKNKIQLYEKMYLEVINNHKLKK